MKKLLALVFAMVLAAALLAACGDSDGNSNNTPGDGNDSTPSGNENTGSGLFDIKDSEITVDGGDLSALPDYLKKGLGGELGYATLNSYSFLVSTYDVKKEQMHDLRDYYAENCEGVKEVNDDFIDDMGMFEIVCEWGQINAVMNASERGGTTVTVMFY